MPPVDPDDANLPDLIARMLAGEWPARTKAEHQERRGERRQADRRGLGGTARRQDDAELHQHRRQFLADHLSQLPAETRRLWIDGLWLGQATEAQLAALVEAAIAQRATDTATRPTKKPGRPASRSSAFDDELRARWHTLTQEFKPFSRDRKNQFNPSNRRRASGQRLVDFRRKCRESPIGQRVDRAGLFDTFFEDQALGPGPMAARLMHREHSQHLMKLEQAARAKAQTASSVVSRDMALLRADQVADMVKQLPTWRTVYDWLRRKPLAHPPSIPLA